MARSKKDKGPGDQRENSQQPLIILCTGEVNIDGRVAVWEYGLLMAP